MLRKRGADKAQSLSFGTERVAEFANEEDRLNEFILSGSEVIKKQ